MSIEERVVPTWADHPGWDLLGPAWRRRDNLPLRNLLASILDDGSEESRPGGALLGWRRLSQAVFTGHDAPLLAHIEELDRRPAPAALSSVEDPEARTWALRSLAVIDELLDAASDEHVRRAPALPVGRDDAHWVVAATVAVFVYFETLVFWEHSDEHAQMSGVLLALRHEIARVLALDDGSDEGSEQDGSEDGSEDGCDSPVVRDGRAVMRTVDRLAASLPSQFENENGLGCSCPVSIRRAAGDVVVRLAAARDELPTGPGDTSPTGVRMSELAALLDSDIEHTIAYFDLLAKGVAPAVELFDANLIERSSDAATAERLRVAIEHAEAFEAAQRVSGVFASEARANRVTLEAMRGVVAERRRSLRVDDGEVTYIYPFGLPLTLSGGDVVERLLHLHFKGDPSVQVGGFRLADCPVTIDDTPQTSNWIRIAGDSEQAQDNQHLEVRGVRLLFERDALDVVTGSGVRYEGLGIEVRLGVLGNHYVRISISTSTVTSECVDADGSSVVVPGGDDGWSPHSIDQLVRLAGEDVGPVSIRFVDRDRDRDGEGEGEGEGEGGEGEGQGEGQGEREEFTHLTALVGTIVTDLMLVAEQLDVPGRTAADPIDAAALDRARGEDAYEWDRERNTEFVRRHAQVMLTVADASAVGPEAPQSVMSGEELGDLFGAGVLLAPQRSFATSLDEWARFELGPARDADWLRSAYRGVRGELISCSGDTTLVFAPTAPNWQILEDRELVEFAASLTGAYSMRRVLLRRTVDRAAAALRPAGDGPDTDDLTPVVVRWWRWLHGRHRSEVQVELSAAQDLEREVSGQLRGVETLLDHARSALVSRNQRDRQVLERLCASNGVDELRGALGSTVDAAVAQQGLIRSRCAELEEDRRFQGERLAQSLLAALGAFAFIDLFWWAGDVWSLSRAIWWIEFVFIVLVVALVVRFVADPWFERRRRRRSRAAALHPPD